MELGISDERYCFTVNYLCGKDLIRRFGHDPEEYSRVFITIEGVDAYEQGLLVGPVVEELVAETREFVDSELERLCPAAAKKLAQTYIDVVEGSTELRWSQVAYACREILKDFTDAICDPEFLGAEIDLPDRSETKNKIRAAREALSTGSDSLLRYVSRSRVSLWTRCWPQNLSSDHHYPSRPP